MNLEIETRAETLVAIVLESRMEAPDASTFRDTLFEEIEKGASRIVLDLAAVRFIDSTSIGAIVSVLKKLGRSGEIVISGAQGSVRNVFRLTRMDKVFQMADDVSAALRVVAR